jgi:hypothetical protein
VLSQLSQVKTREAVVNGIGSVIDCDNEAWSIGAVCLYIAFSDVKRGLRGKVFASFWHTCEGKETETSDNLLRMFPFLIVKAFEAEFLILNWHR